MSEQWVQGGGATKARILSKSFARLRLIGLTTALVVLLAGCAGMGNPLSAAAGEQEVIPRRLLLWHTWTGAEAHVLHQKLDRYMELHPDVKIIADSIPEEQIVQAFARQDASGLGPDLVLVDAGTLYDLVQANLVRDVGDADLDLTTFLSKPLRMVTQGDSVYGLPFASHTHVLFYNRSRTDSAPDNVWEWLTQAQDEEVFALNTGFIESYWGIGAYHGRMFDDETNEVLIHLGGFKNWLQALQVARMTPNIILDNDVEALRNTFLTGEADYYFGRSSELPDLRQQLGDDAVGIATLPMGPNYGIPSPLLFLSAIAFGNGSTPTEFATALDLAEFLITHEEQLSLALADVGRVPVNNQVRITASMPERTITVARQAGSAIETDFPTQRWWRQVQAGAISLIPDHHAVVEGVMEPDEFLQKTSLSLQETFGFTEKEIDPAFLCPERPVAIDVWHALSEHELAAMTDIAAEFATACPGAEAAFRHIPSADIFDRFVAAAEEGGGPVLLYESSRWLPQLAELGVIQDISEEIDPAYLQHLQPRALRMTFYAGRLYGIPESISVMALYYNPAKVDDAPSDLDLLLERVDAENRLALTVGFFWGYWGMRPLGAFVWDRETGSVRNATGLTNWLDWLKAADKWPGVDLFFDLQEAEELFAAGDAAYLVSGPWSLSRMDESLGGEGFRVVPLPGGNMGPGSPMLRVRASMINVNANQAETETALAFAQFLNLNESQQRLLDTQQHVSASVIVDLSEFPKLTGFREQARLATMMSEDTAFRRMEALGDDLYRAVLIDGAEPAAAVARFVEAVSVVNQAEPTGEVEGHDGGDTGAGLGDSVEESED